MRLGKPFPIEQIPAWRVVPEPWGVRRRVPGLAVGRWRPHGPGSGWGDRVGGLLGSMRKPTDAGKLNPITIKG